MVIKTPTNNSASDMQIPTGTYKKYEKKKKQGHTSPSKVNNSTIVNSKDNDVD
jgi:hypothetical protein